NIICVWQQVPVKVLAVFFRAIRSFRKNRPYAPEVIHRILRQAAGGTSEQEHTLPDVLWNHESHMRFPTDMKLLWESIEWLYSHICRHCRDLWA
ncbi:hypothetical protein PN575_13100, partial [Parabacteroides merdae]|nr:hypothetical protein [Parabacteroides merdae]